MNTAIVLLLASSYAFAQSVKVDNGNLIFVDRQKLTHVLTTSGRDSDPFLSTDNTKIVFARALREADGVGLPRVTVNEFWTIGTTPNSEAKRIYSDEVKLPDHRVSLGFWSPSFSPDNRTVYFLADFSATSAALCKFDFSTAKARFLSPAMNYFVFQNGPYKGAVLASIRTWSKPDSDGQSFPIYPYDLLDSNGKKLRRAPCEELDAVEACAAKTETQAKNTAHSVPLVTPGTIHGAPHTGIPL